MISCLARPHYKPIKVLSDPPNVSKNNFNWDEVQNLGILIAGRRTLRHSPHPRHLCPERNTNLVRKVRQAKLDWFSILTIFISMLFVLSLWDHDKYRKDQLKESEKMQPFTMLKNSEPAFILIFLGTSKVLIWGILITAKWLYFDNRKLSKISFKKIFI